MEKVLISDEEKVCGNCTMFAYEDTDGLGLCYFHDYAAHCGDCCDDCMYEGDDEYKDVPVPGYWSIPGVQTVETWEINAPYLSTPEAVLNDICRLTNISREEIKSKSRKLDIAIVRHVYCYAARELTGASVKEIGELINRNYATVIHSCRVIKDAMETNDRHVIDIMEKIKSIWK